MKFTKNTHFWIAKNVIQTVSTKQSPLDYSKWTDFIDKHPEHFTWKENTEEGIELLKNIDKVPENFKNRIMISLNKGSCFKEFDETKRCYNINVGFNDVNHRIGIGFERIPKMEDLRIFVEMAKYLDALLLKDGKTIIDEKVLSESI